MSRVVRTARLISIAILVGWSASQVFFRATDWSLSDMDAYWNAAMRIRDGDPLFPQLSDVSAPDVYRYAPWFAALWVPLTHLPKVVVSILWSIILVGAVLACLKPLLRLDLTSIAAATFFGSFLVWGASIGNVQPLLVAGLLYTVDRRAGPLVIGVTASLKAVPILFVLLYVGRREWGRAAVALGCALVLTASFLLVDLTHYPSAPGDAPSPLFALSPILFGVALVLVAAVAIRLASLRSAHDRLGAAGAALAALPRITLLDLPLLLVGVRPERRPRHE